VLLIPPVSQRGIELSCVEASAIDSYVVKNARACDRHHDSAKDSCPGSVAVLLSASHPRSPMQEGRECGVSFQAGDSRSSGYQRNATSGVTNSTHRWETTSTNI
jgi:hypothetical protein